MSYSFRCSNINSNSIISRRCNCCRTICYNRISWTWICFIRSISGSPKTGTLSTFVNIKKWRRGPKMMSNNVRGVLTNHILMLISSEQFARSIGLPKLLYFWPVLQCKMDLIQIWPKSHSNMINSSFRWKTFFTLFFTLGHPSNLWLSFSPF